jgi:hypothetical protein
MNPTHGRRSPNPQHWVHAAIYFWLHSITPTWTEQSMAKVAIYKLHAIFER